MIHRDESLCLERANKYFHSRRFYKRKKMSLILDRLYIGSLEDARDDTFLDKHEISHVISILDKNAKANPSLKACF